jgi:hypothetical protein
VLKTFSLNFDGGAEYGIAPLERRALARQTLERQALARHALERQALERQEVTSKGGGRV